MGILNKTASTIVRTVVIVAASAAYADTLATSAQSLSEREYQIKAAFLYNFVKFVDWPGERFARDQTSVTLCVFSGDPIGDSLESAVQGKTVKGHSVDVARLNTTARLGSCHLLFVGPTGQPSLPGIIEGSYAASVLTVSDQQGFVEQGGMISLVKRSNKIGFDINLDAAKRAKLKLSSKLLTLASTVTRGGANRDPNEVP